jgi:hypothetical protein
VRHPSVRTFAARPPANSAIIVSIEIIEIIG